MLPSHHKIREIVESAQFSDELRELEPDAVRADELFEGAVWVLSRNPEYGTKTGPNVWFLPMLGSDLVIRYTFDENHVYFLSIQPSAAGDVEEE
jgi:hypothetical protein